jgi:hypothetical protein
MLIAAVGQAGTHNPHPSQALLSSPSTASSISQAPLGQASTHRRQRASTAIVWTQRSGATVGSGVPVAHAVPCAGVALSVDIMDFHPLSSARRRNGGGRSGQVAQCADAKRRQPPPTPSEPAAMLIAACRSRS